MPKKLLLADDSITIQKVVELILSEEDVKVTSVGNGEEALALVETFKPDLVLADVDMPKMNGYDLCKAIKAKASTSHIPVILLVGAFEPVNEKKAKEVGAVEFLIKPFESQEFLSKINAVMASAGPPASSSEADGSEDMSGGTVFDSDDVELDEESLMDEATSDFDSDINLDSREKNVEETSFFDEEGGDNPLSQDELDALLNDSEMTDVSDIDVTTNELKDVLESLSEDDDMSMDMDMGPAEEVPLSEPLQELSETLLMDEMGEGELDEDSEGQQEGGALDQDLIDSLIEDTTFMNPEEEEAPPAQGESPPTDEEDVSLSTDALRDVMDHISDTVEGEDTEGANAFMNDLDIAPDDDTPLMDETSLFEEEDNLLNMADAYKKELEEEPSGDLFGKDGDGDRQPQETIESFQVPPPLKEERPYYPPPPYQGRGDVLITSSEVIQILNQSLHERVSGLLNDGMITTVFREAVAEYVQNNFGDITRDLTGMVEQAINSKVNSILGQINVETIINQVISSTVHGILTNLAHDVFRITSEIIEHNIKGVIEKQVPMITSDVERAIIETLPDVAERIIRSEIEQIKAEFM